MSCRNPWRWSLLSSYPPSPSTLLLKRGTSPSFLRVHSPGVRALLPNRAIAIKGNSPDNKTLSLPSLLQYGTLLTSIAAPAAAMAVTGDNNVEEDLVTTLVTSGIVAVLYLLVFPPIIMNWLRLRWYKRRFLEMYFQFMFVFLFFPGLMLWAPFLNFRPLPRDPTMKYPWSTPKDVQLYKSR
uniref:NADH dehydrogenase-like complex L n=1 Tax=Goodyera fumata TaxID=1390594 RepID=A0A0F7GYJ0_9ASPA